MATKWNDLKHKTSPEKREQLKREAVAEQMNIPQSAASRIERQRDFRLSTLQRYVAALGGRLEVHAVFPDDIVDLNSLMDASAVMQGVG